jgi:Flp pilus assembly protein TadG
MAGIRAGIVRFGRDRRGIAAIEFAFIAPILLAMYFLTMEVTQAIETNKKLNRVAAMVGDLATQQGSVTKADLKAIMQIADSTLLPYHRSKPKIVITAISVTGTPLKAIVQWSQKVNNGTYSADAAAGAETSLPGSMMTSGRFVVRVESDLDYKPVITWAANGKSVLGLSAAFDSLSMSETAYLSPRMTTIVTCSDCYN